ncbi:MAG: hypothetical protein ABSC23_11865 [Bryobacteraceae bacterium]|jgi:hypothetical protein
MATKKLPKKGDRKTAPKKLSSVLKIKVIKGQYYCACTDQGGGSGTGTQFTPHIELDEATIEGLSKIGVRIPKLPKPSDR